MRISEKQFIDAGLRPGYEDEIGQEIMTDRLTDIDRTQYSHLLIVLDTFHSDDPEIYSVEVPNGKVNEYVGKYTQDMQSVMRVVELEKDNRLISEYIKRNHLKKGSSKDDLHF